jgi:hypothetical protein
MTTKADIDAITTAGFSNFNKQDSSNPNTSKEDSTDDIIKAGFSNLSTKSEDSTSYSLGGMVSGVGDFVADVAGDISGTVTGSTAESSYPQLQGLPEFGSTIRPDDRSFIKDVARSLSFDDKTKKDIIKEQYKDRVSFEDVGNGEYTIVNLQNQDGSVEKSVLNAAGLSSEDVRSVLGTTAGFIGTELIGRKVKPVSEGVSLLRAALVPTIAEVGMQAIQTSQGMKDIRPLDIVLSGSFGGLGEIFNRGLKYVADSKNKIYNMNNLEDTNAAKQAFKEGELAQGSTGIDLFPAQKTSDEYDLARVGYLKTKREGAPVARRAIEQQNKQVEEAADRFSSSVSTNAEASLTAPDSIIGASRKIINNQKVAKRVNSTSVYKRAEKNPKPVNTGSVVKELENVSNKYGSAVKEALEPYVVKIQDAGGDYLKLKTIKEEMDDAIKALAGNPASVRLKGVSLRLRKSIEDSNPLYKAANKVYQAESKKIEALENTLLGKLSKITKEQDKTNVYKLVFNPEKTTPKAFKELKKEIIAVDPQAWRDLIRGNIDSNLGKLKPESDAFSNVPKEVHTAIFGQNRKSAALMREAVKGTPAEKKLNFLDVALNRAKLGRDKGSDTESKLAVSKEIEKGGAIAKTINNTTKLIRTFFTNNAADAAQVFSGGRASVRERVLSLADTMFDPKYQPQWDKITAEPFNSNAQTRALYQLLDNLEYRVAPEEKE